MKNINRGEVEFLVKKMFQITTAFSQYRARDISHGFVDLFQSTVVNICNSLCEMSPYH